MIGRTAGEFSMKNTRFSSIIGLILAKDHLGVMSVKKDSLLRDIWSIMREDTKTTDLSNVSSAGKSFIDPLR